MNNVGTVFLQVPANSSTLATKMPRTDVGAPIYLLVTAAANNGDFTNEANVTKIEMTLNGDYLEATYNFTDGDYFTFASEVSCIGPAGIASNLELWLKANDGTDATAQDEVIGTWTDASEKGNHGTGRNNPEFQATGDGVVNYNPSVAFNGTSNYFELPDGFEDFTGGASSFVIRKDFGTRDSYGRFFHLSTGGMNNAYIFGRNGTTNQSYWTVRSATAGNPFTFTTTTNQLPFSDIPNLLSYTQEGGFPLETGKELRSFFNGELDITTNSAVVPTKVLRTLNNIGKSHTTEYMNGYIPEFIIYTEQLTDLQAQKVSTSLGLKYGLSFNHNYISPAYDGTNAATETLYDITSYNNRIFGVGYDKMGCLSQNQSTSQLDGSLIRISVDGVLNPLNSADNTVWTADRSFIVMGDDDKDITTFVKAGQGANEPLPAIYEDCFIYRLNRNWKVQVKGAIVPDVFISIPANSSSEDTKLPTFPDLGTLRSYESNSVYVVLNDNQDFTVNANMQEVALTYNATTDAYEGTITVNPSELANHTFYYTVVSKISPSRTCCLKSNNNIKNAYESN